MQDPLGIPGAATPTQDVYKRQVLLNGSLFSGKQIFKKEHLKREDGVQGVILRTEDGRETVIERYRELMMTADDGTRIIVLACEN